MSRNNSGLCLILKCIDKDNLMNLKTISEPLIMFLNFEFSLIVSEETTSLPHSQTYESHI